MKRPFSIDDTCREIVSLMSHAGPYPGLWVGDPLDVAQVRAYLRYHAALPMLGGHTKNSLEMLNTRRAIARRTTRIARAIQRAPRPQRPLSPIRPPR